MKQIMKRSLALALCLALALSLAACGGSADSQSGSSTEAAEPFDYSALLEDNGFWKDVKASELVTLPEGYVGIEFPYDVWHASDEDVQDVVDDILKSRSTGYEQITDRAVEDGDRVSIDYVGSVDGVEFTGGNTQGTGTIVTAGSPDYIDDFLTQIIGHMPGEEMDVVVTFPDDYRDSTDAEGNAMVLAGKEAVFKTTIHYIQGEAILPELNDAFVVENFGPETAPDFGFSTVEELREGIRTDLSNGRKLDYLRDWLMENAQLEAVPEAILEHVTGSYLDGMTQQAASYGLDLDSLLEMQGTTREEMLEIVSGDLEKTARYTLILQAVAEAEGLSVTEADVRKELGDSLDQLVELYGKGYVNQVMLTNSVLDYLTEHAVDLKG